MAVNLRPSGASWAWPGETDGITHKFGVDLDDGAVQRISFQFDAHAVPAGGVQTPGRAPHSSTSGSSVCKRYASCRSGAAALATCSPARQ